MNGWILAALIVIAAYALVSVVLHVRRVERTRQRLAEQEFSEHRDAAEDLTLDDVSVRVIAPEPASLEAAVHVPEPDVLRPNIDIPVPPSDPWQKAVQVEVDQFRRELDVEDVDEVEVRAMLDRVENLVSEGRQ